MSEYPRTIDNGAGERLTFARRIPSPHGDRIEGETVVAPGAGPPMHVHHLQEEGLTVVRGRLGYQRAGQEPAFAGVGETVVFPAGDAHRFWNAGENELRCTAYIQPAGNFEYFLGAMFRSQMERRGRRPGLFDVAFLTTRYSTEYEMLELPGMVRRFILPLLARLGGALGMYGKYGDAPEAIRG
jgi:quercetin dioxygenase-like cupin family protein